MTGASWTFVQNKTGILLVGRYDPKESPENSPYSRNPKRITSFDLVFPTHSLASHLFHMLTPPRTQPSSPPPPGIYTQPHPQTGSGSTPLFPSNCVLSPPPATPLLSSPTKAVSLPPPALNPLNPRASRRNLIR
jgi:hypothetical protein